MIKQIIFIFLVLFLVKSQLPIFPCKHGCSNGQYYHLCQNGSNFWCHDIGTCEGCVNADNGGLPILPFFSQSEIRYTAYLKESSWKFKSQYQVQLQTGRNLIGYHCQQPNSKITIPEGVLCQQRSIHSNGQRYQVIFDVKGKGGYYPSMWKSTFMATLTVVPSNTVMYSFASQINIKDTRLTAQIYFSLMYSWKNGNAPFMPYQVAMRFACMIKDLKQYKLGEQCGLWNNLKGQ